MALSMGIPPAVSSFRNVGNASFASLIILDTGAADDDDARGGIKNYS
jgi:hypothetical protein